MKVPFDLTYTQRTLPVLGSNTAREPLLFMYVSLVAVTAVPKLILVPETVPTMLSVTPLLLIFIAKDYLVIRAIKNAS